MYDSYDATSYSSGVEYFTGAFIFIYLVVIAFFVICFWKIFTKAGKPGWAAIVPIYNIMVLCEIAGKPAWWVILFLIPCVNIVIMFIVYIALAEAFGKSAGFGVGLALLGIIFFPILAFGSAEYIGVGSSATGGGTVSTE